MVTFFEKLAPMVVAIETYGGSHHWARASSFGHQVKLIAPQLVKPYVKRGRNDATEAEAPHRVATPTTAGRCSYIGTCSGARRRSPGLLPRTCAPVVSTACTSTIFLWWYLRGGA